MAQTYQVTVSVPSIFEDERLEDLTLLLIVKGLESVGLQVDDVVEVQ